MRSVAPYCVPRLCRISAAKFVQHLISERPVFFPHIVEQFIIEAFYQIEIGF